MDFAPSGYIDLSYHNYPGHIQEATDAVPVFCRWAVENGITDIPEVPLEVVMAMHDFDLHVPLEVKGTTTDEQYSALILGRILIQFPKGGEVLNLSMNGVIATTPNLDPDNNFELAARMLDTGNVCSEDETLALQKTLKIMVEEELELKNRITGSFKEKRDIMANFLRTNYYPGPIEFVAEDGSPVIYEPSLIGCENVRRLGSISQKEFISLVPEAEAVFAAIWPEQKIF
jgi:hypothetical protein